MNNISLLMWTYYLIAVILIIVVLNVLQQFKLNKYKQIIDDLEKQKNLITSIPILSELSKIQAIVKNEKLEEKYNEWNARFDNIKTEYLTKISDMILDLDFLMEQRDYSAVNYKIAKVEMEIYTVRTKVNLLLGEIKEVTLSEEKNRNTITRLKSVYRDLTQKFNNNKNDYDELAKPIELQFENIQKRFQEFEQYMENNDYEEVIHIVNAIDEMINNMSIIIEEGPDIILMAKTLIPKKITEVNNIYNKMTKEGYQLEYLNLEYNIEEVSKKINTILDKVRVLNLEDSLFELKTILDYFDSLFNDYETEKLSKNSFEENINAFKNKLNRLNKIIGDVYLQLDRIKFSYDLSDEEIKEIDEINKEVSVLNVDFNNLMEQRKNRAWPFSKLSKELENLNLRLTKYSDSLDEKLQSIGSMHDDEIRAREQLEDIKTLLNKAKGKIRGYRLPLIPNSYYIELKEASESIRNIVIELDKKPIAIKILNIRVDTARDLVLKLYNTTNEMVKTAMLSEMAIVYGNRYRSLKVQVDQGLNNAEILFNKGEYKLALETSINTIDLVEPGIYQRLLNVYSNDKNSQ